MVNMAAISIGGSPCHLRASYVRRERATGATGSSVWPEIRLHSFASHAHCRGASVYFGRNLVGLYIVYALLVPWLLGPGDRRRFRETLCATQYAKARGYQPETLRMFSFPWSTKAAAGDLSDLG